MYMYVHARMYPPIYKMHFKGTDGIVKTKFHCCNKAENVSIKASQIPDGETSERCWINPSFTEVCWLSGWLHQYELYSYQPYQ